MRNQWLIPRPSFRRKPLSGTPSLSAATFLAYRYADTQRPRGVPPGDARSLRFLFDVQTSRESVAPPGTTLLTHI